MVKTMKRSIIVFHSSPVKIEKFRFDDDVETVGVHFGGFYSSLEAASRKAIEYHADIEEIDRTLYTSEVLIYIHKCILTYNTEDKVDVTDLGSNYDWYYFIDEMKLENHTLAEYKNIYEPDNVSSWFVLQEKHIELVEVSTMTLGLANKTLDIYHEENYNV